jgi:peptide-methionine (R)-S-oxide reductase
VQLSEDDFKKKLTKEQYKVLRQKGTEAPFSGEHYQNDKDGKYSCVACGQLLFTHKEKYDSDIPGLAGWPSFSEATSSENVEFLPDDSMGMVRTEVVCKNCKSHLGHIFDDGGSNTGKHYCINSVCLDFEETKES